MPPVSPFSVPPPGLVGSIARYIHDAAPRPVPEIALAGAIGLMAGVCGRAYNVSGTGLNQYVLLLAETATGKEAIATGISGLVQASRNRDFAASGFAGPADYAGPAEISSAPALIKHLANTSRCFVSVVGEYGIVLQQMTNPRAPAHLVLLKRTLLDLYNKSGRNNVVHPTIYSDREKNTAAIKSPALTLLGESTPGQFYEALDASMIASGLLPRFTIIEYRGDRPPLNKARITEPHPTLLNEFSSLCKHVAALNAQDTPTDVQMTADAEALFDGFNTECDEAIVGKTEINRQLWSRAHVKAMKLAALITVGVDSHWPVITPEVAEWAIALERSNVTNLVGRFARGETGEVAGNETKQQNEVIRCVSEYVAAPDPARFEKYGLTPAMHRDRIFTQSYLSRRLINLPAFANDRIGATNALSRTLKALLEGNDIQEIPKSQMRERYGVAPRAFAIGGDLSRFREALA